MGWAVVRFLRIVAWGLCWLFVLGFGAWSAMALAIDLPMASARLPVAIAFGVAALLALIFVRGQVWKLLAGFCACIVVLVWWLTLLPSNERNWQGDVDRTAHAEIDGDTVTIHNVRNFDYRAEFDYTPRWETRTYDLSQIRGVDLFLTFWGSPWIAHPIASFEFADGQQVAFSIEVRKEVGEAYSSVLGFFRQYELIYTIADERDVVRLRTNYRTGEDVYLYRSTTSPEIAREILLDYLRSVNEMHQNPVWYNALTSNCTTNIRLHTKAVAGDAVAPWDWRLLLNGKSDEFAYQYGRLVTDDLPFDELKRRAYINEAARAADQSADFSALVRTDRPGF